MLGAIVGDFVGSVHEHTATKHKDLPLVDPRCFVTDNSLLTVAVAEWPMDGTPLVTRFHDLVAAHPGAGWGLMFARWARARRQDPTTHSAMVRPCASAPSGGRLPVSRTRFVPPPIPPR